MCCIGRRTPAARPILPACMQAGQALMFERTDNTRKSHRGVQRELERLTKDDSRFDLELRTLLGRTYDLKAIADYETGPGSEVSVAQAEQVIATARRFIDVIAAILQEPEPDRSA
jgi:uncharacterized protein (UPF0332 family)